uniref:Uncharacterized protein n=1 Tax=Candidatus Kentrum sp. LPFa TaxID=2126335 RepID=A0A450W7P2_9GAMM|nr:MAG: hypothetical protein BECKLPF1236B_GA0070989_10439 [Candidatus Kentron sp. LPFa]
MTKNNAIGTLWFRLGRVGYRKNEVSEGIGVYAKAHPAPVLLLRANMFMYRKKKNFGDQ